MIANPHDGIRAQRLLDRVMAPTDGIAGAHWTTPPPDPNGVVKLSSEFNQGMVTVYATIKAELPLADYLTLITVGPAPVPAKARKTVAARRVHTMRKRSKR